MVKDTQVSPHTIVDSPGNYGSLATPLVISTVILFKNSKSTKELKGTSHFKFKAILYTLLCGP